MNICPKCGLPKELCVCETIAKENQEIKIKKEKRKYGKIYTIVTGFEKSGIDIEELAKKLKSKLACGGTVRGFQIELQGDHKKKVKSILVEEGFPPETIIVE